MTERAPGGFGRIAGRVRSSTLGGGGPAPARRLLATSGGMLFGSGATLVLAGFLVDAAPGSRLSIALPALGLAYVVALVLLAFPEFLPVSAYPALTAAGTLLITVVSYADGAPRSAYVLLYIWAAVYAFYFYSLRVALLEAAWISLASAVGMAIRAGGGFVFSEWLLITGTCLIGGLIIRRLLNDVRLLAEHDALTGLYNRRALEEHIDRDLRRAARTREPLSILMLDVDNLKVVNDAFGHQMGDRLLREAARAWKAELRGGDVIARFGGDEFMVVMPACSLDRAVAVADRLRAVTPDGLTASAGACEWDGEADVARLIALVDSALYRAKSEGRDRTVASARAG